MDSDPKTLTCIWDFFPNWNSRCDEHLVTTVLPDQLWTKSEHPAKYRRKGRAVKKRDGFAEWFSFTMNIHGVSYTRDVKSALLEHCKKLDPEDAEDLIKQYKDSSKEQILAFLSDPKK